MISPIYNQGPAPKPTGQDANNRNASAYQKAWHDLGLLIIDPATVEDEWLRQGMINEANKRYLKRGGKNER